MLITPSRLKRAMKPDTGRESIYLPTPSDADVERKHAQAIASLPDSITHYYAYSNEDFTVISLRLPVP